MSSQTVAAVPSPSSARAKNPRTINAELLAEALAVSVDDSDLLQRLRWSPPLMIIVCAAMVLEGVLVGLAFVAVVVSIVDPPVAGSRGLPYNGSALPETKSRAKDRGFLRKVGILP